MTEFVPQYQEAEHPLSPAEIEVLRRQFEREGSYVTIQTKFNYAWGLIKSDQPEQVAYGISLLSEIYTDSPERRRECLYYLALGHYKISNFVDARQFNRELLRHEPNNIQALALNKLIDERVSREGVIGLAIVSGVLTVGAVLVAILIRRAASKK
ncbi:mitochondria fission 1 protein [Syncephalastrum racemosum]|uniref:Mitochondrial fission 1 protein n=1 Tax=Syncephalastrum racemosum TaxID=13706 RepID=A0A1X2HAX5_SYNRA|nr:mitochondria fission 1 protein [Syncephalastrum racemosum]